MCDGLYIIFSIPFDSLERSLFRLLARTHIRRMHVYHSSMLAQSILQFKQQQQYQAIHEQRQRRRQQQQQ